MAARFIGLALPGVQGLAPYQPGKPMEELERELGISDIVKLASNENPLGPSARAVRAAQAALSTAHRYPDGNGFRLRKKLSERLGVAPAQITLGNGSSDPLEFVVRVFAACGGEVLYAQHAFAMYPIVTAAAGARGIEVPARNWGHDLDAMARAITPGTRVVFVANPNNPTGTWVDRDALRAFLEQVPSSVIVVLDEAYFEYIEEPGFPDAMAWFGEFPNLVVTRTFSKIYGLAGFRVGYGVSDAEVADLLNRVRPPFNVGTAALAAAEAALDDEDHVRRSVALNREGMAQLVDGFAALGLAHIPSVGNFVCVELARAAKPVFDALLREGVIVRPVANYGMPNHLRITVGTRGENTRVLAALKKVLGR